MLVLHDRMDVSVLHDQPTDHVCWAVREVAAAGAEQVDGGLPWTRMTVSAETKLNDGAADVRPGLGFTRSILDRPYPLACCIRSV